MHIVEVDAISFHYPQNKYETLRECSLTVDAGDLISILGPNGAGKSTMLNCSCGLLVPQKGSVLLNGINIRHMTQRDIARTIGYVQQYQHSAFPHTVFDYVLMGRASNVGLFHKPNDEDYAVAEEAIDIMGLNHLKEAAVTEISGGERQQAAIARAVAQKPKVIFFDEPTAHLDYGNQLHTLRLISNLQKNGFAIVMTTHNPDHCMMLGGRVAILNKEGHLESGTVDNMLTEQKLQSVYNVNLHLTYIESAGRTACIPEGL